MQDRKEFVYKTDINTFPEFRTLEGYQEYAATNGYALGNLTNLGITWDLPGITRPLFYIGKLYKTCQICILLILQFILHKICIV